MSTATLDAAPVRRRSVLPARVTLGLLLALAVSALYVVTAGNLVGYEPETVAVSEGLVTAGQLRVIPGEPMAAGGLQGRLGHLYSRVGLTQPLLEAPFYWVGEKLDDARLGAGGGSVSKPRWRLFMTRLFDPLMATLTVVSMFVLLLLRGVSERRALGIAALAAVATLIWPYSKMGMDTTLMAMLALTLAVAAWAARRPKPLSFGLCGVAGALTANSKPYGALLLLGAVPLLWPALVRAPRRLRVRLALAVLLPLLGGAAAVLWYNGYRTGSISSFGDPYSSELLATPINAIGLFASPGKGLLWYSPLVILGLLGMRVLWREDRPLALACIVAVTANTLVIAASSQWGDETWGPRYIVPSAWLLVLPLAWWVQGQRRMRWLFAMACIAVAIQVASVVPRFYVWASAAKTLSGQPLYPLDRVTTTIPYGDDGPRWIPEMSPLLFQGELLAAWLKQQATGSGFIVSYTPYRGYPGSVDLRHPSRDFGPLPDFWWTAPNQTAIAKLFAFLVSLIGAAAAVILVRRLRRPQPDHRTACR